MTLSDVNNAASTKSRSDRTGSDRIVHFGLRILRNVTFGFRFSVFGFRQKFKRDFKIFSGLSSI